MSNTPPSPFPLPVIADVDVVVVGATSAAVSLALSAQASGLSVYVLSSRPYLGEDICAAYRFWPTPTTGCELSDTIFSSAENPPRPMHVKLTLEQSLVEAGIPFLFNSFPAGVLRSDDGQIQGIAVANRTGLQAIRARLVVDATLDAMVLKQAGSANLHALQGTQTVEYVTLCEGPGKDAEDVEAVAQLPGYKTGEYAVSARRYTLEAGFGDGSPKALADAYGEIVDRCRVATEYRHQTRILPQLPASEAEPQLEELMGERGLMGLSESMRLTAGAEAIFANPLSAMRLAGEVGRRLAGLLPARIEGQLAVSCAGSEPIDRAELHTVRDTLRQGDESVSEVTLNAQNLPVLGDFDVLVAGGGTGGAPAAISAARAGAKTLVVELTSGLGGVGTMGQIANYWFGYRVGFTAEIDEGVRALEHKEYFKEHEGSWSVAAKSTWFHQTGREAGCTYWFNTVCAGTSVEDGRVTGVLVAGPYGYGLVRTGCVVDSTGCSDIPAAAGAPTVVIGKEHIAVQGTGLAGIKPGRDYHNSDHNFSDDTDMVDATAMLTSAKLKFKDDYDCGELVDSRERRQIVGDYAITPVDILYQRRFPDTVCVATSNFDSHGFTVDPVFMLVPPNKKDALWADIPLRCLLPRGLDGVLVTGLGLSAHRDALPVIRMQADVQNQGYAAGYIAALSAKNRTPIRDMNIHAIQQHLIDIGGLPSRVLTDQDSFPVPDEAVQRAVTEGWDTLPGVALILHEDERSIPLVREAYAAVRGERSPRSLRYAQILALLGDATGQEELIAEISARPWDEGWRFRGMHQFGKNLSELDVLLVCLGAIGDAEAWPCILEKIETLPMDAEFSHFRAIAMCCEALWARHPEAAAAPAIAILLERPGYHGHAHTDIHKAQADLTGDINENQVRDNALREIHLARALFNCGDVDDLGRTILEEYTRDYRGHFARHAKAILQAAPAMVIGA